MQILQINSELVTRCLLKKSVWQLYSVICTPNYVPDGDSLSCCLVDSLTTVQPQGATPWVNIFSREITTVPLKFGNAL